MPKQSCHCGAKYSFPESAIGKRAKCKKCGTVFTISPDEDREIIPLAEDDPMGGFAAAVELSASDQSMAEQPKLVSEASLPSATSQGRIGRVVVEEAPKDTGYARALFDTLLFPKSLGNLVTFIIWSGLIFVAIALLSRAGNVGRIGQFIVFGWFAGFRLGVIARSASGEKDLPTTALSEGPFTDIIVPMVKWLASWLIVLAPASVCLIVMVAMGIKAGANPTSLMFGGLAAMLADATAEMMALIALAYAGAFMWPIVVLCIVLGGFSTFRRPDLIIVTLFKTFPVYVLTALIVFGADLLKHVLGALLMGTPDSGTGSYFGGFAVIAVIQVYMEIVAMRAIGLYYHHFKHRFAWSWG